jgi:signal transduction histidine kinase
MAPRIAATTAQRILVIVLSAMPVRRVATDLRALLESTIKVMELQARTIDVALTLEVGPDVPRLLLLDPAKMAWTITALIGNALRFVRRGTRLMPGGTIKVRARYEPAGSRVVLEVQDDGAGIRQQTLSELLHRPAGQLHSAGLALGLMQDVAAAHGGDVQLESSTEADRSGTTVRLTIPCH